MPSPPDLSSHRLPPETALRIFQSEILPAEFLHLSGHVSPSEPPFAILTVGQTGAGKSRMSPAILSAMRLARRGTPVHLVADTYKTYHPDYARLLLSTPHLASAATGSDARRWLAMAAGEATRCRLDVLVESACRHPDDFSDLVRIFGGAGYVVKIVVLAVPAPLSRLGILVRYYEGLPEGRSGKLPLRLTPQKIHDDSYSGLLDAARFLDSSGLADQVLLVRRGNMVAYGVVRGGASRPGVADALVKERQRPLTREEMETALDDISRLEAFQNAKEQVALVRNMLGSLTVESNGHGNGHDDGGQRGAWPHLVPLLFGNIDQEVGRAHNVLHFGQM